MNILENVRSNDHEVEKVFYRTELNETKTPVFSLHELKDYNGVQAITVYEGPLFVDGLPKCDLMKMDSSEMRYFLGGSIGGDSGGDIFVDYGICPYFEFRDNLFEVIHPSAIIVASQIYLNLLLL